MRKLLAAYRDAKDLIEIGAYMPGSNPLVDRAVQLQASIELFLCQEISGIAPVDESWAALNHLVGRVSCNTEPVGS